MTDDPHVDRAAPQGAGAHEYVQITPAMIDAGVECLRDLLPGEDIRYVVESIYMAMEYEKRLPTVLSSLPLQSGRPNK
jgi:hypothetical protein